jgi:gamma-glutamylcyclotransferase
MTDRWYFAYGSNLSTEQKESRTGTIRDVKVARLDGYRITFDKRGSDGTGKANIVRDAARVVWGVVYRCSPATLDEMDYYEGVAGGHYVRTAVVVHSSPAMGIEAVTYVAGDSFRDDSLVPSGKYLKTILRGARQHGLPQDYILEIKRAALDDHGKQGAA